MKMATTVGEEMNFYTRFRYIIFDPVDINRRQWCVLYSRVILSVEIIGREYKFGKRNKQSIIVDYMTFFAVFRAQLYSSH